MNDTQSAHEPDRSLDQAAIDDDPVTALAALDPADAPQAAEDYAEALEVDLESAGDSSRRPVQMQVDLGAGSER
jgi:hypothetical protein